MCLCVSVLCAGVGLLGEAVWNREGEGGRGWCKAGQGRAWPPELPRESPEPRFIQLLR